MTLLSVAYLMLVQVVAGADRSRTEGIDYWLLRDDMQLRTVLHRTASKHNIHPRILDETVMSVPSFFKLCPNRVGQSRLYERVSDLMDNDIDAYLLFALEATKLLMKMEADRGGSTVSPSSDGLADFWFVDTGSDDDTLSQVVGRVASKGNIEQATVQDRLPVFQNWERCSVVNHEELQRALVGELKEKCPDEYWDFARRISQRVSGLALDEQERVSKEIAHLNGRISERHKQQSKLRAPQGHKCERLPAVFRDTAISSLSSFQRLIKECEIARHDPFSINKPVLLRKCERPYVELMEEISKIKVQLTAAEWLEALKDQLVQIGAFIIVVLFLCFAVSPGASAMQARFKKPQVGTGRGNSGTEQLGIHYGACT